MTPNSGYSWNSPKKYTHNPYIKTTVLRWPEGSGEVRVQRRWAKEGELGTFVIV